METLRRQAKARRLASAAAAKRSSYPRLDVIDDLFEQHFGITGSDYASDGFREDLTGIGWLTWYRLRRGINAAGAARPMKASNEFITAVMALFPKKSFTDLFEVRDEAA
jgi:hypothetical protein